MATAGFRVTYATLSADDEELHAGFERGLREARARLGGRHGSLVAGQERFGDETYDTVSPGDTDLAIGTFAVATAQDVDDAVAGARAAQSEWGALSWHERAALLDRAADLISERRNELAALQSLEVGKTRLEALGDVEESADLIRYYTHQLALHDGFVAPMERLSPAEETVDVMRPYGVWGVISPFNFPMALVAGPVGAALAAGNTVVAKVSEIGALSGLEVVRCFHDAGIPADALSVLTGPGETVGAALVEHERVDGLTFTGSADVGLSIHRSFASAWPKPVVCEMGGKNPVVVAASADLNAAVEGTARSAFGLAGQKCSAASRAFVHEEIADEFVEALAAKAASLVVGDPTRADVFVGPVIDEHAVRRYEDATGEARSRGEVLAGGERLTGDGLERGYFLRPTVVRVPDDSPIWHEELFVPMIAVRAVGSVEEAIDLANATPFGLTAGFFGRDETELQRFLDRIEAGVVYVNRRAGGTTGAWPGVQPFGGWKASGTNGKAGGGPYYLQQYLREQSRTIVTP
jgi:1-pyrroline-5-carboxylate dehydrogenase